MKPTQARLFRWLWLLVLLAPTLRGAPADPLQTIEKTTTEWVKVRAETARLEGAWSLERPILEATLAATTERATALEEKREQLQVKTVEEREELAAIARKIEAGTADFAAMSARLGELTRRLQELRPTLPPRLSDALEVAYRSLARTELAAAERMQLTLSILNRCAQFNRSITCDEEAVRLDGEGGPRSLEVIYWGLSHGYALDRRNGKAWIGAPGPGHWRWEPQPAAVAPIARLIDIYRDKANPEFVAVPAQLQPTRATAPGQP